MKVIYTWIFIPFMIVSCKFQLPITNKAVFMTPFEKDQNTTATYKQTIDYYNQLSIHPHISVKDIGSTDSGHPLHEVIVTNDGIFEPKTIKSNNKVILFINNGIHPGEPCGVDASMLLASDLLNSKSDLLKHAVVVIIPMYNIGGSLNRGRFSRANQVGPNAYGFRGNAKNLDLNRDFIKCDSKNARTFASIFNKWKPQIFIDNHTSNGADYQYVMTLIPTQKDKLHPVLSKHMTETMLPELYESMKQKEYEMTPYVYSIHDIPDKGIMGFLDLGRYSSGFGAIHHAISFMPETHMLKEYKDRVLSTYAFSESVLNHINKHHTSIIENHEKALQQSSEQTVWPLQWKLDKENGQEIIFKGFEAKHKKSEVHGQDRLYYDRESKYEKNIKLYDDYSPNTIIKRPRSYIIPQAYSDIIELLKLNGIEITTLEAEETLKVDVYYIDDYSSTSRPYEGHYLHHSVKVRSEEQELIYYEGDYKINTNQPNARYIIETLEPQGPDSFFAWNYFDGILMQKEHYSSYVFEDLAEKLLNSDEKLRTEFENKKSTDKIFASDAKAQLDYIYKQSPHYESTYMRYPVSRLY